MHSVIHKRVFTPFRDVPARIEAIDHSSNSTMAYRLTNSQKLSLGVTCYVFVNQYTIVELENDRYHLLFGPEHLRMM